MWRHYCVICTISVRSLISSDRDYCLYDVMQTCIEGVYAVISGLIFICGYVIWFILISCWTHIFQQVVTPCGIRLSVACHIMHFGIRIHCWQVDGRTNDFDHDSWRTDDDEQHCRDDFSSLDCLCSRACRVSTGMVNTKWTHSGCASLLDNAYDITTWRLRDLLW